MSNIQREDLRNNREVAFVFEDNDTLQGLNGMAREMRGEPNAYGIRVRKSNVNKPSAFWTDDTFDLNCAKIDKDIGDIWALILMDLDVVMPSQGIGTGPSKLFSTAPKTFDYLQSQLDRFGLLCRSST
jgi:hypothetical protein